jgi:hypothetical protein
MDKGSKPQMSKWVFGFFSVLCFVSAIIVAVGDIGGKESIPHFRIKAVAGAVLCGLFFLRAALKERNR